MEKSYQSKELSPTQFARQESIPNDDVLFGAGPDDSEPPVGETKQQEDGSASFSDNEDNVFFDSDNNGNNGNKVSPQELVYARTDSCDSNEDFGRRSENAERKTVGTKSSTDKRKVFRNFKDLEPSNGRSLDVSSSALHTQSRRTQSLPDLIEGLKPDNDKTYDENLASPDVVQQPPLLHSTKPETKHRKKMLQRSVSFQEEPVYIKDQKNTVLLASTDEKDEGYPETPTRKEGHFPSSSSDVSEKRRNFSEGYGTDGSAGSKASSIQSMVSQEKQELESHPDLETILSGTSSSSSTATVQNQENPKLNSTDSDTNPFTEEIPFLSIFEPSTSCDAPQKTIPVSVLEDRIVSACQAQALRFRSSREGNISSTRENLPNFSIIDDESVQVNESQVAMVNNEEKRGNQRFLEEYLNNGTLSSDRNIFDPSLDANMCLEAAEAQASIPKQVSSRPLVEGADSGAAESRKSSADDKGIPSRSAIQQGGAMGLTITDFSEEKNRKVEEILGQITPKSFQQLPGILNVLFSSDSSTPSPTPLKDVISPESLKKFMEQQFSPGILNEQKWGRVELEAGSRCRDTSCTKHDCQMLSTMLKHVHGVTQTGSTTGLVESWCQSVWQHCQCCDDIRCPVQYCQKMLEWCPEQLVTEKVVSEIQTCLFDPLLSLNHHQPPDYHIKFSGESDVTHPVSIDHIPVSRLGTKLSSAILMFDGRSESTYVLKEYPLLEERQQLCVYETLRKLDHPNLVKQISVTQYLNTRIPCLHVCSQLMHGGSLKNRLILSGGLTLKQTFHFMTQILDAVQSLHQLGILYLYWTCGNIFFKNTTHQEVCLGNFSLSCPLEQGCWDIGGTKMCLPPNITPPELINQSNWTGLALTTDSWGVGCLLSEMLSGKPVWNLLRHEDRDNVHKRIHKEKQGHPLDPALAQLPVEVSKLLDRCFQEKPQSRPPLKSLIDFFKSNKISSSSTVTAK